MSLVRQFQFCIFSVGNTVTLSKLPITNLRFNINIILTVILPYYSSNLSRYIQRVEVLNTNSIVIKIKNSGRINFQFRIRLFSAKSGVRMNLNTYDLERFLVIVFQLSDEGVVKSRIKIFEPLGFS